MIELWGRELSNSEERSQLRYLAMAQCDSSRTFPTRPPGRIGFNLAEDEFSRDNLIAKFVRNDAWAKFGVRQHSSTYYGTWMEEWIDKCYEERESSSTRMFWVAAFAKAIRNPDSVCLPWNSRNAGGKEWLAVFVCGQCPFQRSRESTV